MIRSQWHGLDHRFTSLGARSHCVRLEEPAARKMTSWDELFRSPQRLWIRICRVGDDREPSEIDHDARRRPVHKDVLGIRFSVFIKIVMALFN
jgi:hypothetical protein